jgi:uncharacterized protein
VTAHFLAPLLRDAAVPWTLVHEASGRVLATALRGAFDSASRREGLLKQAAWPEGSALIIAPCQAVHTVGMRFAIDVLFVDRAGLVVKARERVAPWRMAGALRAFAGIELPAGTLAGEVLRGDAVTIQAHPTPS